MLRTKFIAVAILVIAASPAFAMSDLTEEELRILQKINANSSKRQAAIGVLNAARSQVIDNSVPVSATVRARRRRTEQPRSVAVLPTLEPDSIPNLLQKNVENVRGELRQYNLECAGLNFMLRQSWVDIGYVSCPQTVDKATGAEISYTDNRAKNNRTWAINGTAALVYNSLTGNPGDPFVPYNVTVGTYVTTNRTMNSAAAAGSSDVDKIAYGGVLELGYVRTGRGANYFRVRGGSVENNLKGTVATNITGEFIPVDYLYRVHYPFRPFGGTAPFIMRVDPAFLVQYAKLTTPNGQVLDFSGRDEALRVGPQLTLNFFPLPGRNDFFSRMKGKISYHWAEEIISGRPFSLFLADASYNLDQAGHFALSFIYNRGRDEDTGEYKNLFKVALTGKI